MSLGLMYITNDVSVAKIAEHCGVDRIFVDLEILGKEKRQKNLNTVISRHSIEDIRKIKNVLTKAELLVRINPININSSVEINQVIEHGADIIMLPMFKTREEVQFFIHSIGNRTKTSLLVETMEAVSNIEQILSLEGIDEIHIGLNDLHLAYKMKFMFEPLADGTVETLCRKCKEKKIVYGFGGIARLGKGDLPAEYIIAEHYRLESSRVILSRSFCNSTEIDDPEEIEQIFQTGVNEIREYETILTRKDAAFFEHNRLVIKDIIAKITGKTFLPSSVSLQPKKEKEDNLVSVQELRTITYKLLEANHLPVDQAEIVSDCFIEADACGVSTHGVSVLPAYLDKLRSGGYCTKPCFVTLRQGIAFSVIDADNAIGAVSALHCMKLAIKGSRETGIFTVFSRNCNTYGAAFYYPLLAARSGLIGITACNSPSAMPACGGTQRLLGTNPLSIAIPCGTINPIIIDMSTSKVAKSKLNAARLNGEQIPLGWALDEEGKPTTDPMEGIKGLLLPMAEHKGYGLALGIDIIAGVLSGAAFLNGVGKFYDDENNCMNVGQTFVAIDPMQIYGEEFYDVMEDYVDTVRSSRRIENKEISLPGDNKWRNRRSSYENGIRLDIVTIEKINQCLKENKIELTI